MDNNRFNPNNFKKFEDNLKTKATDVKASIRKYVRNGILILIAIVILTSLSSFVYIVEEDEVATVKRFGEITTIIVDKDNTLAEEQNQLTNSFEDVKVIRDKGLFFKIPFITEVEKDSSKLITYISNSANINTQDKIKYQIAMYAQWEITHPGLFRTSLGSINKANSVIDEIGYAAVIEKVNSLSSREFLTDKDRLYEVLETARQELNEDLQYKGIALADIEVYRTILPPSNIESTYDKMIAEREAIAEQKRAEGLELYQNTVADTDKAVAEIIAESIETSEKIYGEADATALEIYADAFSVDPDFYEYWRSLKAYENAFDANTVIYLDSQNDFLKYFTDN